MAAEGHGRTRKRIGAYRKHGKHGNYLIAADKTDRHGRGWGHTESKESTEIFFWQRTKRTDTEQDWVTQKAQRAQKCSFSSGGTREDTEEDLGTQIARRAQKFILGSGGTWSACPLLNCYDDTHSSGTRVSGSNFTPTFTTRRPSAS